jgi:polyisoprenoid-binding protein YceI
MEPKRIGALALFTAVAAIAQPVAIDAAKSTMTVHVYKSGMLSAFGHDHEIAAPISGGSVDVAARKVDLHANAAALRVRDAKVSDKDRNDIQTNMLGTDVLDAAHYAEIGFRSTGVDAAGAGAWKVTGDLTLHGQTHPVSMEVHAKDGHYTGICRFKITDFGMKPVKAAGGTVTVKDEVQIEFDIQLAR